MRLSFRILLTALMFLPPVAGIGAEALQKSLLEQIGLPAFPGAKVVAEYNLPAGRLLDEIVKDVGPWLGLEELKQINYLIFRIDSPKSAIEVFEFYQPAIEGQQWTKIAANFQREDGIAVLFNEKNGLLIMSIDPAGKEDREMTLVRLSGKVNLEKMGDPGRKLPDLFKKVIESALGPDGSADASAASRIPVGQPISVPPAEKLHLKATRSEIRARIMGQNTAEIRLLSRMDDPGELVRIDERLVLALTPKLPVEEVILPGAVPLILELTDGSLTLAEGPGPNDRAVSLFVKSTGAPVTLESFSLISGSHVVKIVGGKLNVAFVKVQGGEFRIDATGDDVTLALPRDVSASVEINAPNGKIQNSVTSDLQENKPDRIKFQIGGGKALMYVQDVNGTVWIKYAD